MPDIKRELDKLQEKTRGFTPPETNNPPAVQHFDDGLPDCNICGNLRWLRRDLPVGHPEFGHVWPCSCAKLSRYAGISGLNREECVGLRWRGIQPFGRAHDARDAIIKTLKRGYGWVYLHGSVGVGKTRLLKTAVAEQVSDGHYATYTSMSEIIEHLRRAYDDNEPSQVAEQRLAQWSGVNVLAIDEIDRLRQTAYASEKQFRLLDERYERALSKESVTIMASNQAPSAFEAYLRDRIEDNRFMVIDLSGTSQRTQAEWEQEPLI